VEVDQDEVSIEELDQIKEIVLRKIEEIRKQTRFLCAFSLNYRSKTHSQSDTKGC